MTFNYWSHWFGLNHTIIITIINLIINTKDDQYREPEEWQDHLGMQLHHHHHQGHHRLSGCIIIITTTTTIILAITSIKVIKVCLAV